MSQSIDFASNPYSLSIDGLDSLTLRVRRFTGKQKLSETYWFDIVVDTEISSTDVVEQLTLGQKATFDWDLGGKGPRTFYGVIARVTAAYGKHGQANLYCLRFVPRLWLLKRKRNSRIFQNMRVPDIVTAVLLEAGISTRWQLTRDYPVREYCTQYEESDFHFVTRILAEAGILFYFPQGGPVDSGWQMAGQIASAVGSAGGSLLGGVAGDAVGSIVKSAASAVGPLLPGDTLIGTDDPIFYPPLGPDDAAALEASTGAALASEAASAVGGALGGLGGVGQAAAGAAGAAAGMAIGALTSQSAPALEYFETGTTVSARDKVSRFELRNSVRANSADVRDYDPSRPLTKLEDRGLSNDPFPSSALEQAAAAATAAGSALGGAGGALGSIGSAVAANAGTVASAIEGVAGETAPPLLEVYDHHAPYLFPKWTLPSDEAARLLRQERRRASIGRGESGCPDLEPGHKFSLVNHPLARLDQAYVVVAVEHHGQGIPDEQSGTTAVVYGAAFECAPATLAVVPRKPKRRNVQVTLTAVVVGPKGSEIYVDAMGQIKVQFHWDRQGKNDDKSSCWIRTMQPWAGAGWGVQFIPRVGMEVVVTFEGGDLDKPMVLGTVYNGTHPSPFALPADATRSGWRTSSSPGGGGSNELSFEDKASKEQIYLHAQKNFDEVVENNHSVVVKNDENIQVGGLRRDKVEKDLELTVRGDHKSEVHGNRVDSVTGDADVRVSKNLTTRVEGKERREVQGASDTAYADDVMTRHLGNATTIIGKTDKKRSWTMHAEGTVNLSAVDVLNLSCENELVISVGKSSIRMTKDRIELNAASVTTTGAAGGTSVDDSGLVLKSKDKAELRLNKTVLLKTPDASLAMDKEIKADGQKILLNSPSEASDTPPKDPDPPTGVELVDQDGGPLAYQRFVIKGSDGSEVGGKTGKDGKAEIDLKASGKIIFPDVTMPGDANKRDMKPYVIKQGDYLSKIAFTQCFDEMEVWNDSKNADVKKLRKNPNILTPGDVVYIPTKKKEGDPINKGGPNKYTANVPSKDMNLVFAALANEAYEVLGLGTPQEGTSDGSGKVKLKIPAHARDVQLHFTKAKKLFPVMVGDMDPIDESAGVRRRLEHLGYLPPPTDQAESDQAEADRNALSSYQEKNNLPITGEADDATKAALVKEHGC